MSDMVSLRCWSKMLLNFIGILLVSATIVDGQIRKSKYSVPDDGIRN